MLLVFIDLIGAEERTRTSDPRITNALLYQLSYFGKTLKSDSVPDGGREQCSLLQNRATIGRLQCRLLQHTPDQIGACNRG